MPFVWCHNMPDRVRVEKFALQRLSPAYTFELTMFISTTLLSLYSFDDVVVVGKRLPPLQSHAFEWVRDWVRVIAALHHAIDKVE